MNDLAYHFFIHNNELVCALGQLNQTLLTMMPIDCARILVAGHFLSLEAVDAVLN